MASTPRGRDDGRVDPGDPATGVRQLVGDPLLRQAVEVASGSLAHSLDRLDTADGAATLGRKRTLSAARTLTRYARRAGGRPTPFGLFAGVGRAHFGPAAKAELTGPGEVAARLDGGWLHRRVLDWLAVPEVRRRVDVVLNDLCVRRDGRLLLHSGEREASVRDNALVGVVRAEAARPVAYAALLDRLAARFPATAPERIDTLLAGLVQHGFLLTSLTPYRIDDALLDRIESALAGVVPGGSEGLRAVRAAATAYAAEPPGAGRRAWQALLAGVHRLDTAGEESGGTTAGGPDAAARRSGRRAPAPPAADGAGRPPVQVDLRLTGDFVLPEAIGAEVRRYAAAIWAMTPEWGTLAYMRDYRDRFIERYGTACAVPLADLVDPHRGLGLPPEYHEGGAVAPGSPGPGGGDADRARRTAVAELVQQAVLDGGDIELTDDDVARLAAAAGHAPGGRPPRTLELCFQVLADSPAALDRGDFLLLGSPHIGSWTAGATAGRFAAGTGLTGALSQLVGGQGEEADDVLPAQVELAPRDPRSLNIVQVPPLLPYRIPVGVADDRGDPHCLDWRTLLVAAGEDGLRLLHGPTGRQIAPVIPHMLALDTQAPPVARFLADLAAARPRVWSGWDWAGLDVLPYLPRVRYGRVLTSPRRWLAGRRLRDAARTPGAAAWEDGLHAWRRRNRVPDRLQIARNDQMFPIDLREPWDRSLLRAELTAVEPRFVLYEDLTADGRGLGWNSGHSTEIVVPLARAGRTGPSGPPATPRSAAAPEASPPARRAADAGAPAAAGPLRPAPTRVHLPGEDWLFVKLYADPAAHDALLADRLPALLAEVEAATDRWFFLRYRDPEPHLRLRFHGAPAELTGRVLPAVARHVRELIGSGAVRTMTLDAYRPETDRYGGPAAQAAAERLFRTDSRSALLQLRARRAGAATVPDEVLAAAGHAVLLDSLDDWDWCAWVDRMFTKGPDHEVYQRHRALADRLIRPGETAGDTARHAARALGMPALADLWTESPEPRAYGELLRAAPEADRDEAVLSLLHIRHNRLFGIDRAAEGRGYAVLRGAVRSLRGRRAHGVGPGGAPPDGTGGRAPAPDGGAVAAGAAR
ncbi:lantibiotic dehydratase [Streptomyces sp. CB02959]|uniref:lantibiotic dehydratase n=1 Tax=Streptomyces sp. CB02959 TaxID=2020330 RepID=UPI000C277378|nr:lantibiotic dehydratase [Streptomyces sp. CB02959]PJN40592.1 lantibiotic dehydratase [Streptomyces sp. CB02959]